MGYQFSELLWSALNESILSYLRNSCNGRHSRTCHDYLCPLLSFAAACCVRRLHETPFASSARAGHEASSREVRHRGRQWELKCGHALFSVVPNLKADVGTSNRVGRWHLKDFLLKIEQSQPTTRYFTITYHTSMAFASLGLISIWDGCMISLVLIKG